MRKITISFEVPDGDFCEFPPNHENKRACAMLQHQNPNSLYCSAFHHYRAFSDISLNAGFATKCDPCKEALRMVKLLAGSNDKA